MPDLITSENEVLRLMSSDLLRRLCANDRYMWITRMPRVTNVDTTILGCLLELGYIQSYTGSLMSLEGVVCSIVGDLDDQYDQYVLTPQGRAAGKALNEKH